MKRRSKIALAATRGGAITVALVGLGSTEASAAPTLVRVASLEARPAAKEKGPPVLPPPPRPTAAVASTTTTSAAAPASASTAAPAAERSAAFAPPPGDDKPWVVMPMLGFSTDDLNLGFGIRGGRMLTDRIYVGGTFVYNLGHSESTTPAPGYSVTSSYSMFYAGPEAGYDFTFSPIVLRTYAGLGLGSFSASSSVAGAAGAAGASVSTSQSKFLFWPGATALYDMPGSSYFVGADARLVFIPGGPALGLFALGGTRF